MANGSTQHSSVEMLVELRKADPEFSQAISMKAFYAGQAVAEPDVLLRNMLILIQGRVQLIHENPNGRRLALATLNPGTVIWEGHLLEKHDPSTSASALTDCVIWMAPSPRAQELVLRHAALCWGMLQTVGERLTQVENRMEEVAFQRLHERLAWLLLDLSNDRCFVDATSHQALADMLGTYRETISAILRGFKAAALVKLGYRRIELCDPAALRAVADGQPNCKTPRTH